MIGSDVDESETVAGAAPGRWAPNLENLEAREALPPPELDPDEDTGAADDIAELVDATALGATLLDADDDDDDDDEAGGLLADAAVYIHVVLSACMNH